jgi:hypothetical protein
VTISGFTQRWQVERHLRDLSREREWCESRGDKNTVAEIDRQTKIYADELKRLRKAEIEEAAQRAAELEQELREVSG